MEFGDAWGICPKRQLNVQTIASQVQPLSMSMPTSPAITILTPVWNSLPYIIETADSIFSQSEQNWQWVVSDNGSTDGSRDYLRQLQCLADQRLSIFFQSENLGIFGNLNFLCQRAQAPLIQILCADDYFATPDSLSFILASWRALDSSTSMIFWNADKLLKLGLPRIVEPLNSQLYFFLHGNLIGNLSNACARREALLQADNFNQTNPYAGDFEYWARFAQSNNLVISDGEYVVVRSHPGQASYHLNTKGELDMQLSIVTSQIYSRIKARGFFRRLLLRVAGTLVYDSQYRSMAMLSTLRGRPVMWRAIEASNVSKQYLLPWFWRTCVFVFSLGGRLGKNALLSLTYRTNRLPGTSLLVTLLLEPPPPHKLPQSQRWRSHGGYPSDHPSPAGSGGEHHRGLSRSTGCLQADRLPARGRRPRAIGWWLRLPARFGGTDSAVGSPARCRDRAWPVAIPRLCRLAGPAWQCHPLLHLSPWDA